MNLNVIKTFALRILHVYSDKVLDTTTHDAASAAAPRSTANAERHLRIKMHLLTAAVRTKPCL